VQPSPTLAAHQLLNIALHQRRLVALPVAGHRAAGPRRGVRPVHVDALRRHAVPAVGGGVRAGEEDEVEDVVPAALRGGGVAAQ